MKTKLLGIKNFMKYLELIQPSVFMVGFVAYLSAVCVFGIVAGCAFHCYFQAFSCCLCNPQKANCLKRVLAQCCGVGAAVGVKK